jgi:hypothetical protein
MRVTLGVLAVLLGLGVGVAGAQTNPTYQIQINPPYPAEPYPAQQQVVQVPDLSGRWILTTTVTNGNYVDQGRIGQGADLVCAQSGSALTCQSRDGRTVLTGAVEGAAVHLRGAWGSDAIHMRMVGGVANSTLMQGHFDANIAVGLGAYQASGEWRAVRATY